MKDSNAQTLSRSCCHLAHQVRVVLLFIYRKRKPFDRCVRVRSGDSSGGGSSGAGESEESKGWSSAGALAGGIGIDARKYVENLLSLNR